MRPFAEFDRRIEAYAVAVGLDVEKPFPFVVEGELADLRWHILVGPPSNPGSHDHSRNAVLGEQATMTATLVGFFSKRHQGVFTHMRHNVHAHLVNPSTRLAAHADQFSIRKGSTLRLPKRAR